MKRKKAVNTELYQKVKRLSFTPEHVAEVGVSYPKFSNILLFIEDGIKADLFEPDPLCVQEIRKCFKGYKNVNVYPHAIYDENRKIELYRIKTSTFVKDLESSPALVNDGYQANDKDLFTAEARVFSEFDRGTIDLLSIDTEGSEWFVIKHMVSRPAIISLETHGQKYVNHYMKEIMNWMEKNHYQIWYKDESDTIYVKNDLDPNAFKADNHKTGFFAKWFNLK